MSKKAINTHNKASFLPQGWAQFCDFSCVAPKIGSHSGVQFISTQIEFGKLIVYRHPGAAQMVPEGYALHKVSGRGLWQVRLDSTTRSYFMRVIT
jgi:hypothetical protein